MTFLPTIGKSVKENGLPPFKISLSEYSSSEIEIEIS